METWKPVVGWEGIYDVSDQGRVKRLVPGKRTYAGRIFGHVKTTKGYHPIALFYAGRRTKTYVHHLVLEAFFGPRPSPDHTANHKDGNRSNNTPGNLEWLTYSENNLHSYRVLGKKSPSRSWTDKGRIWRTNVKLTPDQVSEIRRLRSEAGKTYKDLAGLFGVSKSNIAHIIMGKTWML